MEHRQFVKRDMIEERTKAKLYYDRHVPKRIQNEKYNEFTDNQRVVVQHDDTREWTEYGTIIEEVAPRSYLIKLDRGGKLRRNRRFIRKVYGVNVLGQPMGELSPSEVEIEMTAGNNDYDNDNGSDYDSTSSTIPYENDDDYEPSEDTWPYEEDDDSIDIDNSYNNESFDNVVTSRGRIVKKKTPTDYADL